MPTLTVIAGANGSGKSTLTKQLERSILLIDPDAIAKELNPVDPGSVAIAAGRQAIALSQQYIQSESSFIVETTFAGNTYIKMKLILMCKSDPPQTLKTRLASVAAQAQDVFESADMATSWLKRPNRGLNASAPVDLLDTDAGTEQVLELLDRM
jgi:ABC-type cobalamin/Fe3+-siderophores transport system ATPase subunit